MSTDVLFQVIHDCVVVSDATILDMHLERSDRHEKALSYFSGEANIVHFTAWLLVPPSFSPINEKYHLLSVCICYCTRRRAHWCKRHADVNVWWRRGYDVSMSVLLDFNLHSNAAFKTLVPLHCRGHLEG